MAKSPARGGPRRPSQPYLQPLPHLQASSPSHSSANTPIKHSPTTALLDDGTGAPGRQPRSRVSSLANASEHARSTSLSTPTALPMGPLPAVRRGSQQEQPEKPSAPAGAASVSAPRDAVRSRIFSAGRGKTLARGMKPLQPRVKPTSEPPSSSVRETTGVGQPAYNAVAPTTTPPPQLSEATRLSRWRTAAAASATPSGTPPARPSAPPASAASVPAVYRTNAAQFVKAVKRLNAMTAKTCSAEATTALAFVEQPSERAQARPQPQPPQQASVPLAGSVRKLTTVPLLPLTLCTDGAAVLLIDHNGSARHHNYVAAVEAMVRHRATVHKEDHTNQGNNTAPTSTVLWWTLAELRDARGLLPLSTARAALAETGADSVQPSAQPSPVITTTLRGVPLAKHNLSYGEGIVLLFTSASPSESCGAATSPLSTELLHDLCHGYLPSLLESIYPQGGVQLRGCWCEVHREAQSSLSSSADEMSDASVSIVAVGNSLVHLSDANIGACPSSSQEGGTHASAAAAARTMLSLRPTSFPSSSSDTNANEPPRSELIVDLAESALRFVLQGSALRGPEYATAGSKLRQSPSPLHESSASPARSSGAAVAVGASSATAAVSSPNDTRKASPSPAPSDVTERDEAGVSDSVALIARDPRAFTAAPAAPNADTATTTRNTSGGLVYVSPLYVFTDPAAPPPPASPVRPPARKAAAASGNSTTERGVCKSVMVLTPAGRVELVVPAVPAAASASSTEAAMQVTVRDIRMSLLRSAAGRSMRLREEDVALVYAPGTPVLADAELVRRRHVVLRLRRKQHGEDKHT